MKNEVVKKTEYKELVRKVYDIITTDTSNLVKNNCNTKNNEIEEEITYPDHDKYITIQEFNKLTSENFAATLKQANSASKSDVASFVNKTDFNDKLKDVTSNENKLDELSKKFKALLTKGLTKKLIDKLSFFLIE